MSPPIFSRKSSCLEKIVRLNVTIDEGLVARIDRLARNRSAFRSEAARERLRELARALYDLVNASRGFCRHHTQTTSASHGPASPAGLSKFKAPMDNPIS